MTKKKTRSTSRFAIFIITKPKSVKNTKQKQRLKTKKNNLNIIVIEKKNYNLFINETNNFYNNIPKRATYEFNSYYKPIAI